MKSTRTTASRRTSTRSSSFPTWSSVLPRTSSVVTSTPISAHMWSIGRVRTTSSSRLRTGMQRYASLPLSTTTGAPFTRISATASSSSPNALTTPMAPMPATPGQGASAKSSSPTTSQWPPTCSATPLTPRWATSSLSLIPRLTPRRAFTRRSSTSSMPVSRTLPAAATPSDSMTSFTTATPRGGSSSPTV